MINQPRHHQTHNKLDLNANISKIIPGVSLWELWGITTSNVSGINTSRINSAILNSKIGEMLVYTINLCNPELYKLKTNVTVLHGFSNSPITLGVILNSKIIPYLVVKKIIEVLKNRTSFFNYN